MNPIELVRGLPNWDWSEHCRQEIALTGEQLVEQSDFVWRIGNFALIGFMHTSLTSPPWMWFLLTKGTTISHLIDLRRLSVRIPVGTLTAVDASFSTGLKFAKAYGFEEVGKECEYFGHVYRLMRKV